MLNHCRSQGLVKLDLKKMLAKFTNLLRLKVKILIKKMYFMVAKNFDLRLNY